MADIDDVIDAAITDNIKRAKNGNEEVEAHPLADLLAVKEQQQANDAAVSAKRGLSFMRFKPPGTT
jgi:hypothetical protein